MRRVAILVASVLILGGFSTKAFADEPSTQTAQTTTTAVSYKDEAGITPDSLFYNIDKALDQLKLMLATSEEKKAEVSAEIAQERLGESEVMTQEGKIELAQKALEEYNKAITEAADKLKAVVSNLDTAKDENTDDKLEQSISDLEKAVQTVQDKSLTVLDTLKDLTPKDSADEVEKVIEEQTAHKEAVANFVKERHEFNDAKKALNMAKVALKKVEKSGNDADIKAAQDKLAAAQKEYATAQSQLQAAFQAKKAADVAVEAKTEDKEEDKSEVKLDDLVKATAVQGVDATSAATAEKDDSDKEEASKAVGFVKTNNGNGNGNKKDKLAPGKSGEEHGKSGQAKGKNK